MSDNKVNDIRFFFYAVQSILGCVVLSTYQGLVEHDLEHVFIVLSVSFHRKTIVLFQWNVRSFVLYLSFMCRYSI